MESDVSPGRWEPSRLAYLGFGFLALYGALVLVPWAALVAGSRVSGWVVPAGIAVAGLALWRLAEGRELRVAGAALLLSCVTLVLAGWGAVLFYDASFDGRWYHQSAVLALADGWNPISDADPGFVPGLRYVRSYPKAFWMAAAGLYELVGRIEVGKALHALPLAASFFATLALLLRFGLPPGPSLGGAALAAVNPIWIVESLSFYLDGQVASLLLAALAGAVSIVCWGAERITVAALSLALLLVVNVKFTGLFYAGFVLLGLGATLLWQRRWPELKQAVAVNTLVVVVAVGVVGFNPYVQNQLDFGNPFYPVFGEGSIDFITENTPLNLREASRVERVFYGVFSKPANPIDSDAELMIPFAPSALSVGYPYTGPEARAAGFGPWFSGALVLALVGLAYLGIRARRTAVWALVSLSTLFLTATVFAHPEGWWARYTPQLWLVPVIVVVGLWMVRSRTSLTLGTVIAAVLIVNLVFVARPYGERALEHRADVRAMYAPFTNRDQVMDVHLAGWTFSAATRAQLDEAGVDFVVHESAGSLPCSDPLTMVDGAGLYCPPANGDAAGPGGRPLHRPPQ